MKNRIQRRHHSGFTLLEILLTTAVLLVGLTAVFQTTTSAFQRMRMAKELSEAQSACDAVLNELLAQSSPIQPDAGKTVESLPHWKVQVEISPAPQSGLSVLHLSAHHFSPKDGIPLGVKHQLLRWVPAERVQMPDLTESSTMWDEFGELSH